MESELQMIRLRAAARAAVRGLASRRPRRPVLLIVSVVLFLVATYEEKIETIFGLSLIKVRHT
jgi:hypothetical protein